MQKVLVTGGAGYIGSVLCEHLLDAGYDVTVLDNLMYGQTGPLHLASNPRFHFVHGDVRDDFLFQGLIDNADVVIPLAAIVGAPAGDKSVDTWEINCVLIDGIDIPPDQLIIYPNTNSGYGSQQEDICTEDTQLVPLSDYAKSKQWVEDYLLGESSSRTSDNSIVLRLATVFGMSPRMRTDLLVNDFVYKAVTDGYLVLFEPHFRRNFVHIRDVADCFIHCIENAKGMVGRVYNVGNDDLNMTKGQLAIAIGEQVSVDVSYSGVGVDLDKRDYIVSNQRLRDAGFVASRSLDEGIEELIKGYEMLPRGVYRNA